MSAVVFMSDPFGVCFVSRIRIRQPRSGAALRQGAIPGQPINGYRAEMDNSRDTVGEGGLHYGFRSLNGGSFLLLGSARTAICGVKDHIASDCRPTHRVRIVDVGSYHFHRKSCQSGGMGEVVNQRADLSAALLHQHFHQPATNEPGRSGHKDFLS
jgi:hypothetical protein